MASPLFSPSLSRPEISGLSLATGIEALEIGCAGWFWFPRRVPELAVLGAESFSRRQASPSTSPGEGFRAGVQGAVWTGEQRTRPLSLCLFWGLKFPLRQGDG